MPTVVENDVAALTAAAHWFGDGRGRRSLAVVTIGAGVGYGLVQHDQVVLHPDVGIGLVGHYPLDPNGAVCFDGHRGCATAMLTIPSLTGQASVALDAPSATRSCSTSRAPATPRARGSSTRRAARWVACSPPSATSPCRTGGRHRRGRGPRRAGARRVDAGLAADRDPRASALDVVTRPGDFRQWARGAGVVAIQDFVLRAR